MLFAFACWCGFVGLVLCSLFNVISLCLVFSSLLCHPHSLMLLLPGFRVSVSCSGALCVSLLFCSVFVISLVMPLSGITALTCKIGSLIRFISNLVILGNGSTVQFSVCVVILPFPLPVVCARVLKPMLHLGCAWFPISVLFFQYTQFPVPSTLADGTEKPAMRQCKHIGPCAKSKRAGKSLFSWSTHNVKKGPTIAHRGWVCKGHHHITADCL